MPGADDRRSVRAATSPPPAAGRQDPPAGITVPDPVLGEEWDDEPGVLQAVRRYWLGVLLTVVLGAATGYGLSLLQETLYTAETTVFLDPPSATRGAGGGSVQDPERAVQQAAQIATTRVVAERAAAAVGSTLPLEEFRERYEVEPAVDQDTFTIEATDRTPEAAAAFADAVAQAFTEVVFEDRIADARAQIEQVEEQIEPFRARVAEIDQEAARDGLPELPVAVQGERDVLVERIAALQQEIADVRLSAGGAFGNGVRTIDPAALPEEPSQPQPLRAAAVAGLMSLVLAAGVAWWRNTDAQEATSREDPARVLHTPLLGEVPVFQAVGVSSAVPTAAAPASVAAEAYQFIVASLSYELERGSATVLVTSPEPGDGKSVTALNIAVAARNDDRTVVLVDADARARGLSSLTHLDDRYGLPSLRSDAVPLERVISHVVLDHDVQVAIVGMGEEVDDVAAFFRTAGFRKALRRLSDAVDLVIVDSPPLLAVSETSAMAGQVDGIVLVVRKGTRIRVLEDVAARLRFIGTPVLGYVFNRGESPRGYGKGGYGSYGSTGPRNVGRARRALPVPARLSEVDR